MEHGEMASFTSVYSSVSQSDLTDENKVLKCLKSYCSQTSSGSEEIVEEPWLFNSSVLSQSHGCKINKRNKIVRDANGKFLNEPKLEKDSRGKCEVKGGQKDQKSDPSGTLHGTYFPVEEPWLLQPSLSFPGSEAQMTSDMYTTAEQVISGESHPESPDDQQIISNLLPVNGSKVISEDSVTTVILINSSICTMQRVAVLENGKLVELLLEPLKSKVHCDSVYLGVVRHLVPHMSGAFVDIGCSRDSFLEIKPNIEPYIFPPFSTDTKGGKNGSVFGKLGDREALDNEPVLDEVDGIYDDDDEIEDDSVEYLGDDYEVQVDSDNFDVPQVLKGNYNSSLFRHGTETNAEGWGEAFNGSSNQAYTEKVDRHVNADKITSRSENKWAQVCEGTKVIVQVVKEGLGTKGPRLTPSPSLKSRFWILIARSNRIGISKKISGVERTRLKVMAKKLQPPGFGLTVRTVASGRSQEELQRDLEGLLYTWKSIVDHAKSAALAADEGIDAAVPIMLHRARGLTLSVVEDYFNDKVKSMVVDSPRTYHEVTSYLQEISPNLCDRVELYNKRTPLFDEYKIEEEIDNILSSRVPLENGGYLVIEQTEALASIDVNGGQCVLGQGTSQEKAILNVNLAAARQIARELRLRDIGGIIVVDFIGMIDDSNKRLVYEEMKKAIERDRSPVHVSELSKIGLMEITRKRVRPSVSFMISEPCSCCHGYGRVEALEIAFSKIERELFRLLSTMKQQEDALDPKLWPRFVLKVDRHMSSYLTSGQKTRLAVLSSSLKVWFLLQVDKDFTRGTFELKPAIDDESSKNQLHSVFTKLRTRSSTPPRRVTLFPIRKWKTDGS